MPDPDADTSGWATPTQELARLVSDALPGPVREWDLRVSSVERARDKSSVTVVLDCEARHGAKQQWEVTLPGDAEDDHLTRSALVTTLRANIEEWWDTRGREPLVAARGRRLR